MDILRKELNEIYEAQLLGECQLPAAELENSSDEDLIYEKIHPEHLVDKRFLEYEFFKLVDSLPPDSKLSYKAVCHLKIKDATGEYRYVDNSTQIFSLSPVGKTRHGASTEN